MAPSPSVRKPPSGSHFKSIFHLINRPHSDWRPQKSLTQHCERSEQRLHFEWSWPCDKSSSKIGYFSEFSKTWCLRSNSVTRQVNCNKIKICEKCQNSKCDIFGHFQTMWVVRKKTIWRIFHHLIKTYEAVVLLFPNWKSWHNYSWLIKF